MLTAISAVLVVAAVALYYIIGFALAFFMGDNTTQRVCLALLFILTGYVGLVVALVACMGISAYFTGRLIRKWSR